MLNSMINNLRCDFCEEGHLYYDPQETFNAYFVPETFALTEIGEIIDKAINEYLVFKCGMCKSVVRYTFKEIEKKIRNDMYKKIIDMISIKELRNFDLNVVKKVFRYCGVCPGWDGKGSCPIAMYEKCKLKKIPRL